MVDDAALNAWFCREVLPLEPALTRFIRRNWRNGGDVIDFRQEIYERALTGARAGLPGHSRAYLFTIARNQLINHARRERIVSFELIADLEGLELDKDLGATERHLDAREALRRAQAGLEQLPPRCREVVRLRKVEGLSTKEVAARMGIGVDAVERQTVLGMRALTDFMLGGSGKVRRPEERRRRTGAQEP